MIINRNRQRGAMLYTLIILMIVGTWVLIRTNMALNYQFQLSKGATVASNVTSIIQAWSKSMDYRCVVGDSSTMTLNDLTLSDSALNSLPMLSIQFTAPPLPSIEFTISDLSDVAFASVVNEMEDNAELKNFAPLIQVTQTSVLKIKATRYTSSAESGMIGNRSNGDAVISSVILGGISEFGINGC